MKKLIYTLLAIGMAAAFSDNANARAFSKNNYDGIGTPRMRGQNFDDGNLTPSINDDFAIQCDFLFPSTFLPVSSGAAFAIFTRCTGNVGTGQSSTFPGNANPAMIGVEIFPPQSSDAPNGPLRYSVLLSDGSSFFTVQAGLMVTADGSATIDYDHKWHRMQFATTGYGTGPHPGTVFFSVDGVVFLNLTGQTNLPLALGGTWSFSTQGLEPGGANVAGHTASQDLPQIDNVRTATSRAGLALTTAPTGGSNQVAYSAVNQLIMNEDYDSYDIGSVGNGNNGSVYQIGSENTRTSQTTNLDDYVHSGGSAQVTLQPTYDSDYGTPGCIFLNQTAASGNYNIVALDGTTLASDATDNIVDLKFPAALSAAQANSLGVTGFVTQRLVGLVGASAVANNNPGVQFSVSVDVTGVLQFDIVQRTGTNFSNSAGVSLGSVLTSIPYDHKWHRMECLINTGNVPSILWDNSPTPVLTGASAGAGRTSVALASGFFPGGNNAGPIPGVTPATLSALATPNVVTAAGAPDEFFAIGQSMTGTVAASQNIRWDNIKIGNPASQGTTVADLNNISSYGVANVAGTIANNTSLTAIPHNDTTVADPWYTSTAPGGSRPSQWAIDITDNSNFGIASLNAVNEFYLY